MAWAPAGRAARRRGLGPAWRARQQAPTGPRSSRKRTVPWSPWDPWPVWAWARPASESKLQGVVLVADLLLQLLQAVEERLGARRAAGDVDVDGDDLVHALDDEVGVLVRAAVGGA